MVVGQPPGRGSAGPEEPPGRSESWLWAAAAGLLLAQAYLTHGAFAWAGVLALGVALERVGEPAPGRRVAGLVALVHALVGLSAWGFVHHGVLVYVGQVAYLGAAGALVGGLAAVGGRAHVSPVRLALAWTALAWAREQGPLAFPLLLGGTQAALPTGGVLAIVGAAGLGGLLVGCGLAVVRAALRWRQARGSALVWLAALVALAVVGGGVSWTRAAGAPIDVRIVQGSVPNWLYAGADVSRVARTLVHQRYYQLTAAALAGGAPSDGGQVLVLLPETALKAWTVVEGGRSSVRLFAEPEGGGAPSARVLTGAFVERLGDDGESVLTYNGVLLLAGDDPRGVLAEVDKRQLAPLVEAWLEPGDGDGLVRAGDVTLGVLVCFESMFSRLARDQAPEAGVLVVVTNDAAFETSPPTYTHALQGWARAVETGRPLVRAAQSGISLVVDERGRRLGDLGLFEVGVLRARVEPRRGRTPFVAAGYLLGPISAVAALVAALWPAWRGRSASRANKTSA